MGGPLVCDVVHFVYMDETQEWQDSVGGVTVGRDAAPVCGFSKARDPNTVNGMCQSWLRYFML